MANETINQFARSQIITGLAQLSETHSEIFKRMYSHKDLSKSIPDIVRDMPEEKLDWALTQVESSIQKMEANSK